jgi:hypothetical protein
METSVNWKRALGSALALFGFQVLIGFVEGGGSSGDTPESVWQSFVLSSLVSLVLAVGVFALLAYRQSDRAWLHAFLALGFLALLSMATAAALSAWSSGPRTFFIVLEWATLLGALVLGIPLGRAARGFGGTAADA